jgi:hypothetical protein
MARPMSELYNEDLVRWSERQAELLRRVALGSPVNEAPDWSNIVEEIESVGRSGRAALSRHIRIILEHLVKLEVSPAAGPRAGWRETIIRARADIEDLLEESPSLRRSIAAVCVRQLDRVRPIVAAVLAAYGEPPRVPLEGVRYTAEQVLGPWLPHP